MHGEVQNEGVRWPLGVVHISFPGFDVSAAAERALAHGFDHVDVPADWGGELVLPVGDRILFPGPARPGATTPAPVDTAGAWARAVEEFRAAPGSRIEPWPGSILSSVEAVRAFLDEVPGLRLTLDTGHVANWGEDPVELLAHADHVQLRQAATGVPQALEGDVDFAHLFAELERLDYRGFLSVEYFDLPSMGWPLDDPEAHAVALAGRLRPLLSAL